MYFMFLYLSCLLFLKVRDNPEVAIPLSKEKEKEKVPDDNPIQSLAFENNEDSPQALIALDRSTRRNNVNLMKSTDENDPNSYIVAKDLSGDVKRIGEFKWKIPLSCVDQTENGMLYSIQIREGKNVHQTEPFYFDSKSGKFKLLREKTTTTSFMSEKNIIYVCLGILVIILALILVHQLFLKK